MYRWVWIMLLCVAGMLLLSACFFGGTVMSAQYDHAQDYQTGAFSYEAAKVRQVNVNWYSGSVSLKVTEREKPEVRESGTDLPAEKALHWRLDGEVLYVEFCASGYVGRFSGADKKLTVEVPKGILLNVTTTSAGIAADIGEQAEVTLHSTSGTIEVTDGTVAGKLTLGTTSRRHSGGKNGSGGAGGGDHLRHHPAGKREDYGVGKPGKHQRRHSRGADDGGGRNGVGQKQFRQCPAGGGAGKDAGCQDDLRRRHAGNVCV